MDTVMFGRKKHKIAEHVKGYAEGRRLMRHGDGADEWIGMDIVREHLLALVKLGRDTDGQPATPQDLARVLRQHGLASEATALEVE